MISIDANGVTQIRLLLHEQPGLDLHCSSKRLQTTKAYDCFEICALRLINVSSVHIRSEMHARLRGSNTLTCNNYLRDI